MNPQAELILGIDGGGSGTKAVLARNRSSTAETVRGAAGLDGSLDDAEWVGTGISGASNPRVVGSAAACGALDVAVERAFADAGVDRAPVRAACLGIAGAGRHAEQTVFQQWADTCRLAIQVHISDDAQPLLWCHSRWQSLPGCGIAVISGTGSIAVGGAPNGTRVRSGGWGYLLDDAGSGFAIGRAAMNAVIRRHDGRTPCTDALSGCVLRTQLLEHLQIESPDALIAAIYGSPHPRQRIAGCTPAVVRAAELGDPEAAQILSQAVSDLTELTMAVEAQLVDSTALPIVLSGGVLYGNPSIATQLIHRLHHHLTTQHVIEIAQEPVLGSVRIAQSLLKRMPAG